MNDREAKVLIEFWAHHIWVSLTLHKRWLWMHRVDDEGGHVWNCGLIRLRWYPHEEYKKASK